jgi:hypothetical protein
MNLLASYPGGADEIPPLLSIAWAPERCANHCICLQTELGKKETIYISNLDRSAQPGVARGGSLNPDKHGRLFAPALNYSIQFRAL